MKVIITGATGMVGKGVLLECLDQEKVEQVLAIGRSKLEMEHPKLKQIIHKDFADYSSIESELMGYDACYLCMGVSAAGLSEEKYTKITHSYTMTLAKTLLDKNPEITCTYVSGEGTDSSEKGRAMWARVKGKTENDLLALGFKQAYMFRPGAIIPLRGIKPSSKLYRVLITYLKWLIYLVKFLAPNSVVNTTQIGLAMLNLTPNGYEKSVLKPKDILILSNLDQG